MNPLISIIVPIYNIERYVEHCLNSIINQTYKNIEILLINDGSIDNSPIICKKFMDTDNRVRVIKKENGGLSSARNAGIEEAQGQYLVFVDGDDYIHPDFVKSLLFAAEESNADIAVCGIQVVDEHSCQSQVLATGGKYKAYNPLKNETLDSKLVEKLYYENRKYGFWYVVAWNKIYKSEIFEELRYDEGKIYEDEFIFHKIIRKSRRVRFIPDELYYYVQRGNGITSEKKDNERFCFLTEIYDRRMECYIQENNVALQKMCSEKYLCQIISKYYLLNRVNRYLVKTKYREIINSIDVSLKFKIIFNFLDTVSLINRFKH